MRHLHAGVDDGDDHARAVEPAIPVLIRADQRHALRERRSVDRVFDHARDPQARGLELGESVRTDFEGHEWHRTVLMKQSIVALGQARQDLGANSRHVTPLHAQGSGGEATLRDVRPAGKPKLHDDAGPAFAEHARAHLGSDYAARRVDCGQVDPEGCPNEEKERSEERATEPGAPS